MLDPLKEAQITTNTNTDSNKQADKQTDSYLEQIYSSRDRILSISEALLTETPWYMIKGDSNTATTVYSELTGTIKELEDLGEDSVSNRINMDAIQETLTNALVELNIALDLDKATDSQARASRFRHIANCRSYLKHSAGLMSFKKS